MRLDVVRKMYAIRLGELVPSADIHVLRGIEGARARQMYKAQADRFGIRWRGRKYKRDKPHEADTPNQALNHAATVSYAAAAIAVNAAGCISQLGFIHEDSGEAFNLDIADLYRDTFTVPVAFSAAKTVAERGSQDSVDRVVRKLAGAELRKTQLIARMIDRIKDLIDADDADCDEKRS